MKWWLILILGILLQPAGSQAQSMLEPFGCPFNIPGSEIEGETITCGIFLVPEDREDPASPLIEIAYAVITAQSASPAPDPLVYLEGGPGGSALTSFDLWLESPFRQNRDIVLIDQRGAGYSFPRLNCWEVETEIDFFNEDYVDVQYENALVDCFDRLADDEGINLAQYNTINNANDVADLIAALGYPQYNLYGVSYGTRLALTVLAERPENIRSVVLDSTYPPVVDAYEEGPLNTYRVFQQLFNDCAADPACNAAYPALEERFFALVDALNDDPIFVPAGYEDLSGDVLIMEMFSLFYDTRVLPYLPRMIAELEVEQFDTYVGLWSGMLPPTDEGEPGIELDDPVLLFAAELFYYTETMSDDESNAMWDALAAIPPAEEDRATLEDIIDNFLRPADALYLTDLLNSMTDEQISAVYDELWWEDVSDTDGMFNSFECHEEMPFNNVNEAELAARDAGIPPQIILTEIEAFEEMRRVCSIWRVGTAPDRQDAPITSDVPTLVLAGDYDPITPPAWGQVAADSLSNSYFYTFPGVGHGVIDGGDCPVAVAQSFLQTPTTAPDVTCISTMRIEFVTD